MNTQEACSGPETLVPSVLRGYRTFDLQQVDDRLRLTSTGVPYLWKPGPLIAGCMKLAMQPQIVMKSGVPGCGCARCTGNKGGLLEDLGLDASHPAPVDGCTCGFYGWYAPEDTRISRAAVFGAIEASGRVQLGTHGFRAEKVKLLAVALPRQYLPGLGDLAVDLRSQGVALYADQDSLVAAFPPDDISGLVDHTCGPDCRSAISSISVSVPPAMMAALQSQVDTLVRSMSTGLSIAKPPPVPRWKRLAAVTGLSALTVTAGAGVVQDAAKFITRPSWTQAGMVLFDAVGTALWARFARRAWRWR